MWRGKSVGVRVLHNRVLNRIRRRGIPWLLILPVCELLVGVDGVNVVGVEE